MTEPFITRNTYEARERARRHRDLPGQRWGQAALVAGRVAFALTPWMTVGFGTLIAFLLVARRYAYLGRAHARILWASVAVYAVAFITASVALIVSTSADDVALAICLAVWAPVMILAGGLEAFTFAVVAAAQGYRPRATGPGPRVTAPMTARGGYPGSTPRTPRESRAESHRGGAGSGEPSNPVPGAEAGQPEPVGTEVAAPHAWGRIRWVAWTLGMGALGLTVAMGLAVHQFQQASTCAASAPSRPCLAGLPGVVSAPGRTQERSGYNGRSDTVYSIVVTVRGSGQRVEVWSHQRHPDFRVGDAAALEQWKGRFIAVTDHGRRVEVDDWNPRVLGVMLWIIYGSVVVAGLLWKVGLLDLAEHPRGLHAVSRSILGWTFFVVVGVLGSFVLVTGLSAPQVYLCWW